MWWMWVSSKDWRRDLQSEIKALHGWDESYKASCDVRIVSNSMMSFLKLKFFAKISPSWRPQSSGTMEWVIPMCLERPPTQSPIEFLISLPVFALPWLPFTKPSMLSLKKPRGGGFQLIWTLPQWGFRSLISREKNIAMERAWIFFKFLLVTKALFSMTNLFLAVQIAIGKATFQGMLGRKRVVPK